MIYVNFSIKLFQFSLRLNVFLLLTKLSNLIGKYIYFNLYEAVDVDKYELNMKTFQIILHPEGNSLIILYRKPPYYREYELGDSIHGFQMCPLKWNSNSPIQVIRATKM